MFWLMRPDVRLMRWYLKETVSYKNKESAKYRKKADQKHSNEKRWDKKNVNEKAVTYEDCSAEEL